MDGLVIDDTAAQHFGGWVHSTWSDHFVGEDYVHDGDEGKGLKTLRFRAKVTESGRYEIRLGYIPYDNRAARVPVSVRVREQTSTVYVDQTRKPPINGLLMPLGTFDLAAGDDLMVEVSNADTDGYVVADCVQIVEEVADFWRHGLAPRQTKFDG